MIIYKNRGSILLVLIYILTIISLLGITAVSIGVINYEMKIMDRNTKKFFYFAEGGIEESKMFILSQMKNAIENGYLKMNGAGENSMEFRKGYIEYLNGNFDHKGLIDKINQYQYSILLDEKEQRASIVKIIDYKKFNDNPYDDYFYHEDNTFTILLESSYSNEKISKRIGVKFQINIPEDGIHMDEETINQYLNITYINVTR